jgi:hypothetical protein
MTCVSQLQAPLKPKVIYVQVIQRFQKAHMKYYCVTGPCILPFEIISRWY